MEIARCQLEEAQKGQDNTLLAAAKQNLLASKAFHDAAKIEMNHAKSLFEAAKIQLDATTSSLTAQKSHLEDEKAEKFKLETAKSS